MVKLRGGALLDWLERNFIVFRVKLDLGSLPLFIGDSSRGCSKELVVFGPPLVYGLTRLQNKVQVFAQTAELEAVCQRDFRDIIWYDALLLFVRS